MTQRTRFFLTAWPRWVCPPSSLSAPRMRTVGAPLLVCTALAACSSKPAIPDWQMNAHGSTEKALQAYLTGNSRVEGRNGHVYAESSPALAGWTWWPGQNCCAVRRRQPAWR